MRNLSKKKLYFILNPKARNAGSVKTWSQVEAALKADGTRCYQLYRTERPNHATALVRQILNEEADAVIVAIGGDGTVHEVMNGMIGFPEATLGYIAAGSGNDFSRGAVIPKDPEQALALIMNPEVKKLDCGSFQILNHKGYFASSLGMGIDAFVTEIANRSVWKKRFNKIGLGKLNYLYTFFKSLWVFDHPEIEVTIDGVSKTYRHVWLVNIANNTYFGGGIAISPQAKMNDGLFHILIAHSYSRLTIFFMFFSIIWGGHIRSKNIEYLTGKNIKVIAKQQSIIHADGEIVGYSKLDVNIMKHEMNVICKLK